MIVIIVSNRQSYFSALILEFSIDIMLRRIGILVALVVSVSSQSLRPLAMSDEVNAYLMERKQPPAIDFLGAGYDAVFGDPLASDSESGPADPGFRQHIVNFTWYEAQCVA